MPFHVLAHGRPARGPGRYGGLWKNHHADVSGKKRWAKAKQQQGGSGAAAGAAGGGASPTAIRSPLDILELEEEAAQAEGEGALMGGGDDGSESESESEEGGVCGPPTPSGGLPHAAGAGEGA